MSTGRPHVGRDERMAARVRAYRLMEALQGDRRETALAGLAELEATASDAAWAEIVFLARLGYAMDGVLTCDDAARTLLDLDELVAWAEDLGPALLAHSLALRAIVHAAAGDTDLVLADAARGLALLEQTGLAPLDACTALVVCAAAYNALSLWELVDGIYDRAEALGPLCEEPIQAAAIAMNRVVIRLEWASALLEQGAEEQARLVLDRAHAAVDLAAGAAGLPTLWVVAIAAARDALQLYLDPPDDPDSLITRAHRTIATLRTGGDLEVLPLAETYGALGLLRLGRISDAQAWLGADSHESSSSGAHTFRLWARTRALVAAGQSSPTTDAFEDYTAMLARQRRDARRAVLAAARSRIAGESTRAERDRLAIDVVLDPLTGLANRRAFDDWLGRDRAEPRLTAVILVDLDNFKVINDRHGHAVGDEVLRQVGVILARHVRPGDLAIRVGGDEFALILEAGIEHDLTEAEFEGRAMLRALDVRTAIAQEDWPASSDQPGFSASAGVAVRLLGAHDRVAASELYQDADRALYAAKVPRQRTPANSGHTGGS